MLSNTLIKRILGVLCLLGIMLGFAAHMWAADPNQSWFAQRKAEVATQWNNTGFLGRCAYLALPVTLTAATVARGGLYAHGKAQQAYEAVRSPDFFKNNFGKIMTGIVSVVSLGAVAHVIKQWWLQRTHNQELADIEKLYKGYVNQGRKAFYLLPAVLDSVTQTQATHMQDGNKQNVVSNNTIVTGQARSNNRDDVKLLYTHDDIQKEYKHLNALIERAKKVALSYLTNTQVQHFESHVQLKIAPLKSIPWTTDSYLVENTQWQSVKEIIKNECDITEFDETFIRACRLLIKMHYTQAWLVQKYGPEIDVRVDMA